MGVCTGTRSARVVAAVGRSCGSVGATDLRTCSGGRRAEAGADGVNAMWLILAFLGGVVVGIHLGGFIALRILTEADGSEANATITNPAQPSVNG